MRVAIVSVAAAADAGYSAHRFAMPLRFREDELDTDGMKMTTDQSMYEQVNSAAADPADIGSRIDPVIARSWLLVNGAHADRFQSAAHSRADIVVLDIEDAVAPKDKQVARDNVVR